MSTYTKIWKNYKRTSTPKECVAVINNKSGDIWKTYRGTSTPKEKIGRISR